MTNFEPKALSAERLAEIADALLTCSREKNCANCEALRELLAHIAHLEQRLAEFQRERKTVIGVVPILEQERDQAIAKRDEFYATLKLAVTDKEAAEQEAERLRGELASAIEAVAIGKELTRQAEEEAGRLRKELEKISAHGDHSGVIPCPKDSSFYIEPMQKIARAALAQPAGDEKGKPAK